MSIIPKFIHRQEVLETERDIKYSDPELPCHGCAHSAARYPFPGFPSGERPCGFCVRNPNLDGGVAEWFGERGPMWYDGATPPFKTPMDCYIATDRSQQQRIFDELTRLELTGKEAPPREKFPNVIGPHAYDEGAPEEIYCCEGGPAPGGHTWTCWGWLGISFG